MKSALFKVQSRVEDTEANTQMVQELESVVFAKDEQGISTEGCGWGINRRIDDDYIEVFIKTVDAVMDMILQDSRLELVKQLEGWSEEVTVDEGE